jgi:hypothetical protein
VFLLHRSDDDRGWARRRILDEGVALLPAGGDTVEIVAGDHPDAAARVLPFLENDRANAALVVAASGHAIFVDGCPPLGLAVLDERAELVLNGTRLYFTAREPLVVERYAGAPDDCALCGDPLEGALVISCTGCGAITHEGTLGDGRELLCFTHHGRCPRCRLQREDFAWMPPEDD